MLVVTSQHEGFGVPVIEAMTLGLPVVANRIGALPEVVGDGGLLVDATDPSELAAAVARVLGEPGLKETLAQAARRRVALLDLPSAGDRAVDLVYAAGSRDADARDEPRSTSRAPGRRRILRGLSTSLFIVLRDTTGSLAGSGRARAQEAPTACCTSDTKRCVDAARSNPAARSVPAATRTCAQRGVLEHPGHGGGERHRRLVGQHQPGSAHGLGHRGDAVGDDGDAVAHGLGQRDAEALVVRRQHEDVGRSEVRLELRAADRTRDVHGRGQPELLDERAQRRLVGHAERRADQVQAGSRVGDTAQDVEHLDEVVRRLVRARSSPRRAGRRRPRAPCAAPGEAVSSASGSSLLACMSISSGTTAVPS